MTDIHRANNGTAQSSSSRSHSSSSTAQLLLRPESLFINTPTISCRKTESDINEIRGALEMNCMQHYSMCKNDFPLLVLVEHPKRVQQRIETCEMTLASLNVIRGGL